MINPFEKRTTEFLRDAEAFLSVVTPEPLESFFKKPANEGRLYDRLVTVIGSPGSGKTTLATLFEYQAITTLLKNADTNSRKPLLAALNACFAISDGQPRILGTRLPLESGYREFWEFPYRPEVKNGLLSSLIQSRAVLGWIRNIRQSHSNNVRIDVKFRGDSAAAIDAIGGESIGDIERKASEVEHAVYQISAALIAPPEDRIPESAISPYRPFDVIDSIEITDEISGIVRHLEPLIILDDAHVLHKAQFAFVRKWLAGRELSVARWMITRMDALSAKEVLTEIDSNNVLPEQAGPSEDREMTKIFFQGTKGRAPLRNNFRRMALDMASRYMKYLPVLEKREIRDLQSFLINEPGQLTGGQLEELRRDVEKLIQRNHLASKVIETLRTEVRSFVKGARKIDLGEDVQLEMLRILIHRYLNRIPQADLFGEEVDSAPSKPVHASAPVADGARIHLLHRFGRPYYYGADAVCDASDENAELFLRLAGRLVAQAETRLTRGRNASLSIQEQHKLLVERANEIIAGWAFPEADAVKKLTETIANQCVTKTKEDNAPLGGGANAIGIPSDEFEKLVEDDPKIARILHYAVGYNAITLVPHYGTKKKIWYLLELGGSVKLKYGLTLSRGGFLEREATDLKQWISEGSYR